MHAGHTLGTSLYYKDFSLLQNPHRKGARVIQVRAHLMPFTKRALRSFEVWLQKPIAFAISNSEKRLYTKKINLAIKFGVNGSSLAYVMFALLMLIYFQYEGIRSIGDFQFLLNLKVPLVFLLNFRMID